MGTARQGTKRVGGSSSVPEAGHDLTAAHGWSRFKEPRETELEWEKIERSIISEYFFELKPFQNNQG
jgi:hypothetical protein